MSYGPCHHVFLLRTNLIKKHNVRWQVVWRAKHSTINSLRKFRSQTSDVWTGEAAVARGVREENVRRERGRNKISGRKGRKLAKQCFFGSKSRLAKAAGAEPSGRMRYRRLHAAVARSTCRSQNVKSISRPGHFWHLRCTRLWREAHFEVQTSETHQVRSTFGSCVVQKMHAGVVQSTFRSQNDKHTTFGPTFDV